MAAAVRAAKSAAIAAHVVAYAAARPGLTHVGLYAAMGAEVDLCAAVEPLQAKGITCVYPRVVAAAAPLQFVAADDGSIWRRAVHGHLEPEGPAVPWDCLGPIFVPGLAFDAQGTRLGYGGGFYDRTLATLPGPFIGVAFAVQRVLHLATLPHDVAMHAIVDEDGVHAMGSQA
jgi:5-formyltetrahydrofolate cyclo-ligase